MDLAQAQTDLLAKEKEVERKMDELKDLQALKVRTANELSETQAKIKTLGAELERQAGGEPREDVERLIEEATKPRVFVQFAGDIERKRVIDPLRTALGAQGVVAPPAERVNSGQRNEVRYFSDTADQRAWRRRWRTRRLLIFRESAARWTRSRAAT